MNLNFYTLLSKFKDTSFYKKVRKEALTNPKVSMIYSDFTAELFREDENYLYGYINAFQTIISFTDSDIQEIIDIFPPDVNLNITNFSYEYERDILLDLSKRPFESWIFNRNTGKWEAPIPYPTDGNSYIWNENTLSWDLV